MLMKFSLFTISPVFFSDTRRTILQILNPYVATGMWYLVIVDDCEAEALDAYLAFDPWPPGGLGYRRSGNSYYSYHSRSISSFRSDMTEDVFHGFRWLQIFH